MKLSTLLAPLFALSASSLLAAPVVKTPAKPTAPAKPKVVAAKPAVLNGIRETKLPNGLTVLTKEVHAAPVVYFSVWYHVGSVNEQVGQSGMSHLLEHMLFKGTKTRGPGVISATLQNNGASFNATTSFDRTNYFQTLASDRLELGMQIEADRMVNSVFDPVQHKKEMTVVRSEYEAGENNPSSALSKAVRLTALQIHPYRWQPIGFRSDIENTSRDEMYAFYKNYYVPNNATIVMVGDFKTEQALAMVRKYFGSIPARPVKRHFITPEPQQEGERRVTVTRAGTTPQTQIVYHIPGALHPDRYALDVLQTALSSGRSARFFQSMIQSGLASSADAYDYGLREPDLMYLNARAQPGRTNAELEAALLKEVARLQDEPISAEELQRAIQQSEAYLIFNKDSVQQQGTMLGEFAIKGDWRYGETYLQNLRRVTPADVQRVAKKYLIERNRTVGYFVPSKEGGARTAAASTANGTPPVDRTADATTDLSKIPLLQSKVNVASTVKPVRFELPNGLTFVVSENNSNPTVALSGAITSAGSVFDPKDKPGLANFTASLLSRGTTERSLLDIARTLEGTGTSVSVSGGEEYASLGGRALTRNVELMFDVLADQLRRPTFPSEELEKARAQQLAGIESARDSTGALAGIAFARALYPVGHPYYEASLDELAASFKSITREDVAAFHATHYAPERTVLTVVGDVKATQVKALAQKYFGDWERKGNLPELTIPDAPMVPAKNIVISIPDKAQADVIYGYSGGLKRTDPDFYRVMVLNTILGGGTGLSSRLATSVRDRLGLVYGIYANTDATLGQGPFAVQFGANPNNVERAVAETRRQINLIREKGVTPTEFAQAVAYITGSYPVTLSTNAAVARQLLGAQVYGLGLDFITKRNDYYRAVTLPQVNAAAKKYLRPEGTLVVAGTYSPKQP
jgi:zinc protease